MPFPILVTCQSRHSDFRALKTVSNNLVTLFGKLHQKVSLSISFVNADMLTT